MEDSFVDFMPRSATLIAIKIVHHFIQTKVLRFSLQTSTYIRWDKG